MIDWNSEFHKRKKFEKIPAGNYRLRIRSVEEKPDTSNADHYYVTFTYDVSGQDAVAKSRLVFFEEEPEKTTNKVSIMAQCFGINSKDIDLSDFSNWVGHYGAGSVHKNTDYNENNVSWFFSKKEQKEMEKKKLLRPWVEGKEVEAFVADNEDFPFFF